MESDSYKKGIYGVCALGILIKTSQILTKMIHFNPTISRENWIDVVSGVLQEKEQVWGLPSPTRIERPQKVIEVAGLCVKMGTVNQCLTMDYSRLICPPHMGLL